MVNTSLWALLGFVSWTIVLLMMGIGIPRLNAILARRAAPNSFLADVPHGSDRYRRTMRAHLNCVENLPLFASLVLLGKLISLESATFEWLAAAVLPARILQSTIHVASGTNRGVLARFWFFVIQLACMIGMIVMLARSL